MNKLVFLTGLLITSLTVNAETAADSDDGILNNQTLDSVVGWVPDEEKIKANRLALMRASLEAAEASEQ